MKKVAFILLLVITILLSVYNVASAASLDGIFTGADSFIDAGNGGSHVGGFDKERVKSTSDLIYNTLLIIGTVAVVLVGTILGIKYMTSSVEGQAKIKETLVPFIAGSVVIFGAFGIWKLVTEILGNIK